MKFPADRVILEIKTSRTGEETPEAMVQFLSSLVELKKRLFYFIKKGIPITLELVTIDQTIHFYITIDQQYKNFVESQLISQYPKALILPSRDYTDKFLENKNTLALGQLKLSHGFLYPIKTFSEFKDVDPLSSTLSMLSKTTPGDKIAIQILLIPISDSWHAKGEHAMSSKSTDSTGASHANPYSKVITEKIATHGFKTAIRIMTNSSDAHRSNHLLVEVAHSFSSYNNPSGNSLVLRRPHFWRKGRLLSAFIKRSKRFTPSNQILNVNELASIYHFPTDKLATIQSISWHKVILSDAPENLPIAEGATEEEKKDINFFASTDYKNKRMIFGIKSNDRRRHVYVIGKTGTGKSTFIANMAINDMRNGKGFAIIDPHGDLCDTIMNYVPSYRVNDIVYLDPSDRDHIFSMNPLEVQNEYQKELVVSGIVAIFHKIYGESWGPRLEYILRNTLLSVIGLPDATLLMVPEMLANARFRDKVVEKMTDPVLKSFWVNEFANYTDKLRTEAISPIQNKVGQFVSSQLMRNIIKSPKSTVDLEKIMDEGKILIMNLSQGKLGEDNAALLGAMIITKLQLAAMNRVTQNEENRRDFYLYVDEFQNFATTSFVKILSEARKYRLNLILANQYISQIPEDVRSAIFGNAGTMMSFLIGAEDSPYMAKEFGERFKEEDLLALGNYQAIIKLAIDSITRSPFLCFTLPLPKSVTQNREKAIKASWERYTKPPKEEKKEESLADFVPSATPEANPPATSNIKSEAQDVKKEASRPHQMVHNKQEKKQENKTEDKKEVNEIVLHNPTGK